MKKIVLFAWGLVLSGTALAQEKIEATIGADFVSQYIWRGLDCGNVSVQPTLGVAYKGFSLSAWGYFNYKAHETSHVFEGMVGYDFGLLSAAWYTNFAGNDGYNKSGKRAYSSYMEVNVPFKLATCEWTGTLGAVPYATTFYDTNGFAVTNIALKATKDIKITETFSVPIFAQVIANPSSQKAYFVFGFTLQP